MGKTNTLTVSYGTFACELEGFDDPFPIMQQIVAFYQNLAAVDPSFGDYGEIAELDDLIDAVMEGTDAPGVEAGTIPGGVLIRRLDEAEPDAADVAAAPVEAAPVEDVAQRADMEPEAPAADPVTEPPMPAAAEAEEAAPEESDEAPEEAAEEAPEPAAEMPAAAPVAAEAVAAEAVEDEEQDEDQPGDEPAAEIVEEPAPIAEEDAAPEDAPAFTPEPPLEPEPPLVAAAEPLRLDAAAAEDAEADPVAAELPEMAPAASTDDDLHGTFASAMVRPSAKRPAAEPPAEPQEPAAEAPAAAPTPAVAQEPDPEPEPVAEIQEEPAPEPEPTPQPAAASVAEPEPMRLDQPTTPETPTPEVDTDTEKAPPLQLGGALKLGGGGKPPTPNADAPLQLTPSQQIADAPAKPRGVEETVAERADENSRRRLRIIRNDEDDAGDEQAPTPEKAPAPEPMIAAVPDTSPEPAPAPKAEAPLALTPAVAAKPEPAPEPKPEPLTLKPAAAAPPPEPAAAAPAKPRSKDSDANKLNDRLHASFASAPEPAKVEVKITSEDFVDDGEMNFRNFVHRLGASSLPELMEASAVYLTLIDGQSSFDRKAIMTMVDDVANGQTFSAEARIKSFGKLVRGGQITRLEGGAFALSAELQANYSEQMIG